MSLPEKTFKENAFHGSGRRDSARGMQADGTTGRLRAGRGELT
jgi:hypothetical protein